MPKILGGSNDFSHLTNQIMEQQNKNRSNCTVNTNRPEESTENSRWTTRGEITGREIEMVWYQNQTQRSQFWTKKNPEKRGKILGSNRKRVKNREKDGHRDTGRKEEKGHEKEKKEGREGERENWGLVVFSLYKSQLEWSLSRRHTPVSPSTNLSPDMDGPLIQEKYEYNNISFQLEKRRIRQM